MNRIPPKATPFNQVLPSANDTPKIKNESAPHTTGAENLKPIPEMKTNPQITDTLESKEYGAVSFDSAINFPEKAPKAEINDMLKNQEIRDSLKNVTPDMKKDLSAEIGELKKKVKQGFADGSIQLKKQPDFILPYEGFKSKSALGSKIDNVVEHLEKKVKGMADSISSDGTVDNSRSITQKTIASLKELSKMEDEYDLPDDLLDKVKTSLKAFPGGETPFDWINESAPTIGIPVLHDTLITDK